MRVLDTPQDAFAQSLAQFIQTDIHCRAVGDGGDERPGVVKTRDIQIPIDLVWWETEHVRRMCDGIVGADKGGGQLLEAAELAAEIGGGIVLRRIFEIQ